MINKLLCNSNITLFSRFEHINDRDLDYIENYKDYYIPVYLDNVMLQDTTTTNTSSAGNTSLGDFNLVLALKNNVTHIYREIDGNIFELEYIDHAKYALLSYDDQVYKYFTLGIGLSFAKGLLKNYDFKVHEDDINAKALANKGLRKYKITSIDEGAYGTGIINCRGII